MNIKKYSFKYLNISIFLLLQIEIQKYLNIIFFFLQPHPSPDTNPPPKGPKSPSQRVNLT